MPRGSIGGTDLNTAVTQIVELLRRVASKEMQVRVKLEPNLGAVNVPLRIVEQALVSLATGAYLAMAPSTELMITTQSVEVAPSPAASGMEPGPYALLELMIQERSHEGTWEIAAVTREIVREAGGMISMLPMQERGVAVVVLFPSAGQARVSGL